jgi:hypothetical protein
LATSNPCSLLLLPLLLLLLLLLLLVLDGLALLLRWDFCHGYISLFPLRCGRAENV